MVLILQNCSSEKIVNIGTGFDYSIKEFLEIIKKEMGLESKIEWDLSKPDGTFEKRTDIQRLKIYILKFDKIYIIYFGVYLMKNISVHMNVCFRN